MITKSKQAWEVGHKVNVGFLRNLEVMAKVPTPGDFAPDAYILSSGKAYYEFVPHNGISRMDDDEAKRVIAQLH